jgi:chlorite dismutase
MGTTTASADHRSAGADHRSAGQGEAPATLEGWYVLHDIVTVDWGRWNETAAGDRERIVAEAASVVARQERPEDGHSASFSLLTQKGDLAFLHYRRDLEALHAAELDLRRTRLWGFLRPAYSYLSVVELGTYELRPWAVQTLAKRGVDPASPGYDEALHQEMMTAARDRLFLAVPAKRYFCFYPMSKRRGEHVNWYALSGAERAAYMRGHGVIGRRYAGRVVQVISGSVGFDDWEWGVTLFADDPLVFKKLVYEMRFDPASSQFALFGPFYVGIRMQPGDLAAVLDGGAPRRAASR